MRLCKSITCSTRAVAPGHLQGDWRRARGTLCSCFPEEATAFSTAICACSLHVSTLDSRLSSPSPPSPPPPLTSLITMDVPEPDQSPFTVVSTHTSKLTRVSAFLVRRGPRPPQSPPFFAPVCFILTHLFQHYQAYLDASTPYTTYRWVGTGVLLFIFFLRIVFAQGWYIGTCRLQSNPQSQANEILPTNMKTKNVSRATEGDMRRNYKTTRKSKTRRTVKLTIPK